MTTTLVTCVVTYCTAIKLDWAYCEIIDCPAKWQSIKVSHAHTLTSFVPGVPMKILLCGSLWSSGITFDMVIHQHKNLDHKIILRHFDRKAIALFYNSTARSLRNAEVDLRLPLLKSAGGQKCFSYRGAKLWNSLGTDAKNSSTLRAFKREVEK